MIIFYWTSDAMKKFILPLLALSPLLMQGQIFYYRDIQPIVQLHCISCHHANGPGPFALCTYADVLKHAETIKKVTLSGFMPPWKADTSYCRYKNERLLSEKEKTLISQWVATGKKEGEKKQPGGCKNAAASAIGTPGMELKMPVAINIDKGGGDKFYVVKIPFEFDQDTFVSCIEFCPGNKKIAHHLNYQIIQESAGMDIFAPPYFVEGNIDSIPTFDLMAYLKILPLDNSQPKTLFRGAWAPGLSPLRAPEGYGIRLPKKGVILLNTLHYSAPPGGQTDSSWFNLFFTSSKAQPYRFDMLAIGSSRSLNSVKPPLNLPPESKGWYTASYTLTSDFLATHVEAHMHLLGKKFKAYAMTNGDTIPLIKINDWDFDWQEQCEFIKPILLKKGTTVIAEGYFDNTSSNPRNPFHPPIYMNETDGMKTTGEMLSLMLFGINYR